MNGQEIITKFEGFIDDALDATLELQLANDAMFEIEEDVNPEGLKKKDTSKSTTVGQTYTTGLDLPDDFFMSTGTLFVGTTPYTEVPFDQSSFYINEPDLYYIDHANGQYHLCGTQASVQTITFPYVYAAPEITLSTSPVWPSRFHSLIPLKMAQMFYAIDGGDKARAWDDRWNAFYSSRLQKFKDYDAAVKLAAMNHSALPPQGSGSSENRINDI